MPPLSPIFLMPAILLGGLLALVPIIVHLAHRQKTTPLDWGAMQFLLESSVRMRARKWVDHWLLMLVRMTLLLVLAALLARPMLPGKTAKSAAPVDVALVLDHSLSMGRRSGEQTLFQQSVGVIEKVRDLLPPGSSISVVLAEHKPRVLTPAPMRTGVDTEKLLQTLRQMPPGRTDATMPDAVQAARDAVNRGPNPLKLILIVSDEQRSNFALENLPAWRAALGDRVAGVDRDIGVFIVGIPAISSAPNISVSQLTFQPSTVGIGRATQISATISNAGPGDAAAVPVELTVDGKPLATQRLAHLAAGGGQTLSFTHTFDQPGAHWVRIRADMVDGLEADNSATTAMDVVPRLPVLLIDGQLTGNGNFRLAQFLRAAMQPVDPARETVTLIQPRLVSVGDAASVALEQFPVVILNDVPSLPSEFVTRLSEHAMRGNGVWIILGPRSQPAFLRDVLGKSPLFPAQLKERVTDSQGAPSIEVRAPDNPMVALLTASERNSFAGTSISQWWQLGSLAGEQNVVLSVTARNTSDPVIVEHRVGNLGGRVVLWTVAADGTGSTLPLAQNFVPLVDETVFYLASGRNQKTPRQLDAGGRLAWTGPATQAVRSIRVLRPDGLEVSNLQPRLVNDTYVFSYEDTYLPGLYELRFEPASIPQPVYYSVNIDRHELDPTTLSVADIETLKHEKYLNNRLTRETLSDAFQLKVSGTEIWKYAALLVLALLVMETLLTYRAIKLQSGRDARELMDAGLEAPR